MDKITIISERHPLSNQQARLEDDGHSAWLYLTKENSPVVTADAWIYNRIAAPSDTEIVNFKTASPPAVSSYAHANARFTPLPSDTFEIKWSADGRSVALLINGIAFGFIPPGALRGYSRHLVKDGPWGHHWDEKLYQILFNNVNS